MPIVRSISVQGEPLPLTNQWRSRIDSMRSFMEVPAGSHFPIQNLPFGVFRRRGMQAPRPAVTTRDFALDLAVVADAGLFDGPALSGSPCFHQVPTL